MSTIPTSGKDGKVVVGSTQMAEVTDWSLDIDTITSRWVSSDTAGGKRTIAGAQECAGSFDFKYDMATTAPIVSGGITVDTAVTLKLYIDSTHFWTVPAIIKSRKHKLNVEGEVFGGSCTFEGDGLPTEPSLP